ncbi:MAG: fasciclin domain-containing protein [Planctomycetota bacterium]
MSKILQTSALVVFNFVAISATHAQTEPLTNANQKGDIAERAVVQTDQAVGLAFAKEVDLNPMLVAFVKTRLFYAVNREPDSKMYQTIFIPSEKHLQSDTFQELLTAEDTKPLKNFLSWHVVYGKTIDEHFNEGGSVMVWRHEGKDHRRVEIGVDENGQLTAGGFKVLKTIDATNGVIHVIDGMLGSSDPALRIGK